MESCRLIRVTSNEPVFTSIYDVKRKVWIPLPPTPRSAAAPGIVYRGGLGWR
jgi:hypothetical protein